MEWVMRIGRGSLPWEGPICQCRHRGGGLHFGSSAVDLLPM